MLSYGYSEQYRKCWVGDADRFWVGVWYRVELGVWYRVELGVRHCNIFVT